MYVDFRNNIIEVKIRLYCSDCDETKERTSIIGDEFQLKLHISAEISMSFVLAVTLRRAIVEKGK